MSSSAPTPNCSNESKPNANEIVNMNRTIGILAFLLSILAARFAFAADYPTPTEGDYTIRDFKFTSGEALPELRLHYRTLGKPEKDSQGKTTNAVLIMHGTTGSGAQFIRPEFAGELFGKDQPLDATKFFIVLPDGIGHDPAWNGGEYKTEPPSLRTAAEILWFMSSNPVLRQKEAPTLAKTDEVLDKFVADYMKTSDANDVLYAVEASHDYDPSPNVEKIRAPLLAINSADDLINPPELGILEREIKRVPHGRALLLPLSEKTRGHGSHTIAALWKDELVRLLTESEK